MYMFVRNVYKLFTSRYMDFTTFVNNIANIAMNLAKTNIAFRTKQAYTY